MPRSLYDPASPDQSIRRMSRLRGHAAQPLADYLRTPEKVQQIPAQGKWHLKNLRSDLSTWRIGLESIPNGRLLEVSWFAVVCPSLSEAEIRARLFAMRTALIDDILYVGSYSAMTEWDQGVPLRGATPTLPAPTIAAPETNEAEACAQADHRFDLELRLNKLRNEEKKLAARSRIPALASEQTLLDLHRVQEEIQSIEQELQS